jgi:CBS domain containing-hemolysin-like protein
MNEQSQNNVPLDRRADHLSGGGSGWIIGVILIVLGGLFLMQNMGTLKMPISNWWALFILIPTISAFERAWQMYREAENKMTSQVSGSLLLGIVLTLVTLGFLFNIGWTYFGPSLIILVGLGILFNTMIPK